MEAVEHSIIVANKSKKFELEFVSSIPPKRPGCRVFSCWKSSECERPSALIARWHRPARESPSPDRAFPFL